MTQPGGDYLSDPEALRLPPMLFDGEEAPMAEALTRLLPAFQDELEAATEIDEDYRRKGPGDMDDLEWMRATPHASREVERIWNRQLGIVNTENFTERVLTADFPEETGMPSWFAVGEEFLGMLQFKSNGPQLIEASREARRLYHESQQMEGPGADDSLMIRRWIHDIYMTLLLRRFIEMGARDDQVLTMVGGTYLSQEVTEFTHQTRERMRIAREQ